MGCCGGCKPKYKRLVDSVFPKRPQNGTVKKCLDQLNFFSVKSPEKLDRIGQYLHEWMLYSLASPRRRPYVFICCEVMDHLLQSCQAQNLSLFITPFLSCVETLLTQSDPDLLTRSTQSFKLFTDIKEDMTYYRDYNFFVSRFSSLCDWDQADATSLRIRLAGLHGLQGLVKKAQSEGQHGGSIFEKVYMTRIVPSMVRNVAAEGATGGVSMSNLTLVNSQPSPDKAEDVVPVTAEAVFRDLLQRVSVTNVCHVMSALLTYLDTGDRWRDRSYTRKIFAIVINAVPVACDHQVIRDIMHHLEDHQRRGSDIAIRVAIVDVLKETIGYVAQEFMTLGPIVTEVFGSLVNHLTRSVNEKDEVEKELQSGLISTIGEFATNLPDYQKTEAMVFILSCIKPNSSEKLRNMLLKTVLQVATKYHTTAMSSALPAQLLDHLLQLCQMADDRHSRLTVHKILHQLIDRNNNVSMLKAIKIHHSLANLVVHPLSDADLAFIDKNAPRLLHAMQESARFETNHADQLLNVYISLALLCLEFPKDDLLYGTGALLLNVQQMCVEAQLSVTRQCALHAIVAALFSLLALLLHVDKLSEYISQVIGQRQERALALLPEMAFNRTNTETSYPKGDGWAVIASDESLFFNRAKIQSIMQDAGIEPDQLLQPRELGDATRPICASDVSLSSHTTTDSGVSDFNPQQEEDEADGPLTWQQDVPDLSVATLKQLLAQEALQEMKPPTARELLENARHSHNIQDRLADVFSRMEEADGYGDAELDIPFPQQTVWQQTLV